MPNKEEDMSSRENQPLEAKPIEYCINLDAPPNEQVSSMEIVEHRKGGQVNFSPAKVQLWLSKEQENGRILGHDLYRKLAKMVVYNVNLLEFFLENTLLIPEDWKVTPLEPGGFLSRVLRSVPYDSSIRRSFEIRNVCFWGTIYRGSFDGRLYVRCLYWDDFWRGDKYLCLDDDWDNTCPTLISINSV